MKVIIFSAIVTVLALLEVGSAYTTLATYHFYNASRYGWNLRSPYVSAYCSTWDADRQMAWLQRYGWTAYCRADHQPIGQQTCGRCLRVTNKVTGAYTTARIIDQCTKQEGGLDLDYETVFRKIDTNGNGYASGHMPVEYSFQNC